MADTKPTSNFEAFLGLLAIIGGVFLLKSCLFGSADDVDEGRLTLPAKEIQERCFREAGIPENEPNYVITEKELDVSVACVERYIVR